jgi:hypothetical protein
MKRLPNFRSDKNVILDGGRGLRARTMEQLAGALVKLLRGTGERCAHGSAMGRLKVTGPSTSWRLKPLAVIACGL